VDMIYRHPRKYLAFAAAVLSIIALPAQSPSASAGRDVQSKEKLTGTYSDMHFSVATGDIGGTEVFILRGDGNSKLGYFALVQFAFGTPNAPFLVTAQVNGAEVEFLVPHTVSPSMGAFHGQISRGVLTGTFANGVKLRLPRKTSFWEQ
jgi:hypothetical protein